MLCPKCRQSTSVIDSRDLDSRSIRRRRQCEACAFRFTTYERFEPINLLVVKRDGSVQSYDRQKISRSIMLACRKLDRCLEELETVVDRIEAKLVEENSPISSKRIGQLVIKELRALNKVAYLRFASVFKKFKTLQSFTKELKKLNIQNS